MSEWTSTETGWKAWDKYNEVNNLKIEVRNIQMKSYDIKESEGLIFVQTLTGNE